jgi:hypothetical protein
LVAAIIVPGSSFDKELHICTFFGSAKKILNTYQLDSGNVIVFNLILLGALVLVVTTPQILSRTLKVVFPNLGMYLIA